MTWVYVIGGMFCAWSMLRIVGNERERRVEHVNTMLRAKAAIEAAKAPEIPVVGSAK